MTDSERSELLIKTFREYREAYNAWVDGKLANGLSGRPSALVKKLDESIKNFEEALGQYGEEGEDFNVYIQEEGEGWLVEWERLGSCPYPKFYLIKNKYLNKEVS